MSDHLLTAPSPGDVQFDAPLPASPRAARGGFVWWLVRRLASAVIIWLIVSILVFALTSILPGDATLAILGNRATPEQIADLRKQLGLDRALPVQYGLWLGHTLTGDLGHSLISNRTVTDTISTPVGHSLILAAAALLVLIPLTLALGIISGIRAGSLADGAIGILSTAFYASPLFVTGTALVLLFALKWNWLPAVSLLPNGSSPLHTIDALVLPAATLVLGSSSYLIRLIRAGTSETLRSDFVEAAMLRGVSRRRIVLRHVLPTVMPPVVQVLVLYSASLFSGVIVVEAVFGYPGIGAELVRAVGARDIPIVQAIAMIAATLVILGNVLADALLIALTPRLREEYW